MELTGIKWSPEKRKVADLIEWESNPRKITPEALARLKGRIQERGFHEVFNNDTENTVLSGTQRRKALIELGIEEVWAFVPDRKLTDEERKAVVLESNRNDGDWDWTMLKDFGEATLLSVGFSEDELRINFGLDTAGNMEIGGERFEVLTVLPPEAPKLKEKFYISFKSIDTYQSVKKWVEANEEKAMQALIDLAS